MGAPKGNQFWKARSTHGRNKIFTDPNLLLEDCLEYFQWCDDNPLLEAKVFHTDGHITMADLPKMRPYTIGGLCLFLGIDQKTWANYRNSEGNEDFFPIISQAEETIYQQKFAGAAAGLLNTNIIARDLGLSDKKEITGADGGPVRTSNNFTFVPVGPDYEPTDKD